MPDRGRRKPKIRGCTKFLKSVLEQSSKLTSKKENTPDKAEFGIYPQQKQTQQTINIDAVQERSFGKDSL